MMSKLMSRLGARLNWRPVGPEIVFEIVVDPASQHKNQLPVFGAPSVTLD